MKNNEIRVGARVQFIRPDSHAGICSDTGTIKYIGRKERDYCGDMDRSYYWLHITGDKTHNVYIISSKFTEVLRRE